MVDLRAEESGPPGLVTEEKKLDARVITVRDGVAFTPGALLGGFVGTAVATTLFLLRGGLLQMLVGGAAALAVFLFVRLSVTRRERLIVAKGRLAFLGEGDQRQTIPVE